MCRLLPLFWWCVNMFQLFWLGLHSSTWQPFLVLLTCLCSFPILADIAGLKYCFRQSITVLVSLLLWRHVRVQWLGMKTVVISTAVVINFLLLLFAFFLRHCTTVWSVIGLWSCSWSQLLVFLFVTFRWCSAASECNVIGFLWQCFGNGLIFLSLALQVCQLSGKVMIDACRTRHSQDTKWPVLFTVLSTGLNLYKFNKSPLSPLSLLVILFNRPNFSIFRIMSDFWNTFWFTTTCSSVKLTKCDKQKQHLYFSNPLDSKSNYSATSNNTKLVHWPLMGGLLYLVQRGGTWAGCSPAQSPPCSTKCNNPPINGQCINYCYMMLRCSVVLMWQLNGFSPRRKSGALCDWRCPSVCVFVRLSINTLTYLLTLL